MGTGSIESYEIAVASSVHAIDLVEYDVEHSERVELLVDLFHLLSNDSHTMLHTEESVSHD